MLKSLDWNAEYEVYVVAENQQGKSKAAHFVFRTSAQPTAIPGMRTLLPVSPPLGINAVPPLLMHLDSPHNVLAYSHPHDRSHAVLSVALYLPVQWVEMYWTPGKARPSVLGKGPMSLGLEGLMLSQSLGSPQVGKAPAPAKPWKLSKVPL